MNHIDPAIGGLLAIALAAIFGVSSALKLRDVELFAASVANYRLLPGWFERPFAYSLPIVEGIAAAGLLFSATRTVAASALTVLLCIFTGAIAINLMRGRTNIDCGCFGPALRQELSGWLLLRNLFLMALAATAAMPAGTRPIQWLDAVTIGLGAAILAVLYMSANYAIGNLPATRALKML
jgi:Methylamine utilisation protein MauE